MHKLKKNSTETWSILLVTLTLEFPFMILRAVIISATGVWDSTLLFFILKNILMIISNMYRIYCFYLDYIKMINQNEQNMEENQNMNINRKNNQTVTIH
jgi:hypothetical protein